MVEGDMYFCNPCGLFLRFDSVCKTCGAPAAVLGHLVDMTGENDS